MIGIVFIVFSALAAVINYELITTSYVGAPAKFIEINILTAVLPFLTAAAVSFITAGVISNAMNSTEEQQASEKTETEDEEQQAKQQAEFDKMIA